MGKKAKPKEMPKAPDREITANERETVGQILALMRYAGITRIADAGGGYEYPQAWFKFTEPDGTSYESGIAFLSLGSWDAEG